MGLERLITSALLAMSVSASGAAAGDSNLMFILDGSNSMWGQIKGVAKISTARTVLSEAVTNLHETMEPSLIIYGHRNKGRCNDIQLVAPFGSGKTGDIARALRKISPRGKTPLAASLQTAAKTFEGFEKSKNSILLISDGTDNCSGNPCAVAGELSAGDAGISVHVIGFNVSNRTRKELQCIAKEGRGEYFDARNADQFRDAVAKVQIIARGPDQAPEPKPAPEPVISDLFSDDFDGQSLANVWQVVEPDPSKMAVDNGNLLLVEGGGGGSFIGSDRSNVVTLSGINLPDGDWTVTMIVDFNIQTAREILSFGLFESPDSYVMASLSAAGDKYYGWALNLNLVTKADARFARLEQPVAALECAVCTPEQRVLDFGASLRMPIEFKLIKEGWTYHAKARLSGSDDPWVTTERMNAQGASGDLIISLDQYEAVEGESFAKVDRIKIEAAN